ncbi:CapA family protein [Sporomusa malonica]|uniref:Poly-gamma-glutamate synthesis protein (Capsule biosynthesis protein) n=1 Tax=Sporomusa malonica TaxID=112901 RepID=A0A1W2DKR4_9FIRM|nr:CapA family protein [Sporomusa malonica]SMC98059.1 poly-gamma-glutamate synthesis protein (capsule biosynthesis protein) [Sporomusa malonica]
MLDEVRLMILGDICPTEDYRSLFDSKDPSVLLHNVLPVLKNSDLCIANLEAPAISSPSPITKCGPVLSAQPSDLALIKQAGIHILSLANNHIRDHGNAGVISTLGLCHQEDIGTLGAGKDKQSASKPYVVSIKNKTIGIIACAEKEFNSATNIGAGANVYDSLETIALIRETKQKCDFLLLLYHGGIEYHPYPSPRLQQRCRMMSLAGADVILCQHSHCIGTIEEFEGATIVYGQGNAIYGYREKQQCWNEGLAVEIKLNGEKYEVSYIPFQAQKDGIHLLESNDTLKRIDDIMQQSSILHDERVIQEKWDEFCEKQKALYLPLVLGRGRVFNKLNRLFCNKLIESLYSTKNLMVVKNLLQCDAHREVMLNILEKETTNKN